METGTPTRLQDDLHSSIHWPKKTTTKNCLHTTWGFVVCPFYLFICTSNCLLIFLGTTFPTMPAGEQWTEQEPGNTEDLQVNVSQWADDDLQFHSWVKSWFQNNYPNMRLFMWNSAPVWGLFSFKNNSGRLFSYNGWSKERWSRRNLRQNHI